VKVAFFYDQSQLVRASVGSVWEAIGFGLVLSVGILYVFLRSWGPTFVATLVIPVTVLGTLVVMQVGGLTFNLMTLGGIAAAIGLVIDNAIVVVEAIHTRTSAGGSREEAISVAIGDIFVPLVGSTLTPVVVFLPLAFFDGITGAFFRPLALTMVCALLTSLVLALTLTPSLAGVLLRAAHHQTQEGRLLGPLLRVYERSLRWALGHRRLVLLGCGPVALIGVLAYSQLETDFLPAMDEGGFVIDYFTPPGTSLAETDRQLRRAEEMLVRTPEVESYSRRTGARLALAVAEPNAGDFLVKLRPDRKRSTEEVIAGLRDGFSGAVPGVHWEFPGILGDLIGDLTWSPKPIEIKLFSNDTAWLEREAPLVEKAIATVPGVVDTFDGLVYTGPTVSLRVREVEARRFGLTADDIATAVNTAMLGHVASSVLQGDRVVDVRVLVDPARIDRIATLESLPLRGSDGQLIQLSQVANVVLEPGQLQLRREDLRQDVAVTARLEGRDLGSAMADIRALLAKDPTLPASSVEFGGLYQQQQESFRNMMVVLVAAVLLVFTVLLLEFRTFREPIAIVFGAVLALVGTVLALWVTGTTLNIVSFLGAVIGVGIVAKNGILVLDQVETLRMGGLPLEQCLIEAGRRRLRPVLMTSLAAGLGMLPLAWGIGSGADMLRPLAIAVIGALCISVVLSLVATPTLYAELAHRAERRP
jgi:multidrug efflux pump subunit AcrB